MLYMHTSLTEREAYEAHMTHIKHTYIHTHTHTHTHTQTCTHTHTHIYTHTHIHTNTHCTNLIRL